MCKREPPVRILIACQTVETLVVYGLAALYLLGLQTAIQWHQHLYDAAGNLPQFYSLVLLVTVVQDYSVCSLCSVDLVHHMMHLVYSCAALRQCLSFGPIAAVTSGSTKTLSC
jgi:hypothetical protein